MTLVIGTLPFLGHTGSPFFTWRFLPPIHTFVCLSIHHLSIHSLSTHHPSTICLSFINHSSTPPSTNHLLHPSILPHLSFIYPSINHPPIIHPPSLYIMLSKCCAVPGYRALLGSEGVTQGSLFLPPPISRLQDMLTCDLCTQESAECTPVL